MSSNVLPFGKRNKSTSFTDSPLVADLIQSGAFSSETDASVWLTSAARKAWAEVRAHPPSGGRDIGSLGGAAEMLKEIGQPVELAPAVVIAVHRARAEGIFQ